LSYLEWIGGVTHPSPHPPTANEIVVAVVIVIRLVVVVFVTVVEVKSKG